MVTLKEKEIEKGLEIIGQLEGYLNLMPNTRVRNFIKGTLREYRFHLFFNRIGVFATDLDFVVRNINGAICCLLEVKDHRGSRLSDRQALVYLQIAEALDVPFYFIRYTEDFVGFWLYRYMMDGTEVIHTKIRKEVMSEEALREFLHGIVGGADPTELETESPSLEVLY